MLIRSTGLGRTLLAAEVAKIEAAKLVPSTLEPCENGSEPTRMLMTMETLDPVNWIVRIFLEPADLRRILWILCLHPSLLFSGLGLLFGRGSKSKQSEPTTQQEQGG